MALREEIRDAINRHSAENNSNTPDHVLAAFLMESLRAFDQATAMKDRWYAGVKGPAHSGRGAEARRRENGQRAYREGVGVKDNPFPVGTRGFWAWTHGWTDGYYDEAMLAGGAEDES